MSTEPMQAILRYRLEQAEQTLEEASVLANVSLLRGAVNRAYYAMFYATLALLATRRLGTSKHSSVLALFDREFIKAGLLPKELSRSLRNAFDLRQEQDYRDYSELSALDEETVRIALTDAQNFVDTVNSFLIDNGYLPQTV